MSNHNPHQTVNTWATIIMAIGAVAGVFVGWWFNWETLNQAQIDRAAADKARQEQLEQFEAERRGWEQSLKEATKDRKERAQQFQNEYALMKETFQIQREQWEERKERDRQSRQQRTPLLAVSHCCSPVAILLADSNIPGIPAVRLPITLQESTLFPEQFNKGFVVRIINLGPGAALRVRTAWQVETIRFTDGSIEQPQAEDPLAVDTSAFTAPYYVGAAQEAEIRSLPLPLYDDWSRRLSRLEGFLELQCQDNVGESHRFKYDFWMEPIYAASPPIEGQVSYIHVHIENERVGHQRDAIQREPDLPEPASPND